MFPNLQIFKDSSLADDSKQKAIIKNNPSKIKVSHSEQIQCYPSWRAHAVTRIVMASLRSKRGHLDCHALRARNDG